MTETTALKPDIDWARTPTAGNA